LKKHFDILGLKQDASQEQIQEAYDRLSKELNPSNNDNQAFFKEEYEKVQEAYKAISKSSILKNNNSFSTSSPTKKLEDSSSSSKASGSLSVTISPEKIEELKTKTLSHKNIIPDGLKILCILSMIGSGFISLIFFGLIFSSFTIGIFFLILTIPFVLKFIGALRMYKAKKNGYLMYMIPSILLNILFFLSLITGNQTQPFTAAFFTLTMIVFSIIFHSYKKYLS
jgi:hypothetical protein